MRNFLIILFFISIVKNFNAQEADYKGPAKMYVNSFWRTVESAKNKGITATTIQNLERSLSGIKEKDPSYNISQMEEELSKLKTQDSEKKADEKSKQDEAAAITLKKSQNVTKGAQISTILDKLFKYGDLQIGNNNVAEAEKEVEKFKSDANEVIVFKQEGGMINDEGSYIGYIRKENVTTDDYISKVKANMKNYTEKKGMTAAYYELMLHLAYWDAAAKLFPSESSFKTSYTKFSELANSLGTKEEMEAKAGQNEEQQIKERKPPVPSASDPVLEKAIVNDYNKKYSSQQNATAYKAILTDADWTIKRNSLTSVIIDRTRSINILVKGNDGKCYLLVSGFVCQQYVNGSFQSPYISSFGFKKELLCENAK